MIRRDRWPTAIVFALVALGLAAGLVDAIRSARDSVVQPAGPAPAFEAMSQDGSLIDLDDFEGKVLLIDFFATWCKPCEESMLVLIAAARSLEDRGVLFLAASGDEDEPDRDAKVRAFFAKIHVVPPQVVYPSSGTLGRYRVRGYPTTVLIDRQRQMRVIGGSGRSEVQLRARLEEALAAGKETDGGP